MQVMACTAQPPDLRSASICMSSPYEENDQKYTALLIEQAGEFAMNAIGYGQGSNMAIH